MDCFVSSKSRSVFLTKSDSFFRCYYGCTVFMKYCLSNELEHFFEKHHFVLVEGLLSQDKVQELLRTVSQCCSCDSFVGRDLALSSDRVRAILLNKGLASIAQGLSKAKKLRYGTDWVWQGPCVPWNKDEEGTSLASMVCVRPALMGAIVALSDGKEGTLDSDFALPKKAGDVLFFSAQDPFIWKNLSSSSLDQKYILLLYAGESMVYTMNPKDPYTHYLKEWGYGFGDRLKETTHPTVIR